MVDPKSRVALGDWNPGAAYSARAECTREVLGHTLDTVLRLLHPVIPFVTERLWTTLTGGETLVIAEWPTTGTHQPDADVANRIALTQQLITEVRHFRADQDCVKLVQEINKVRKTGLTFAPEAGSQRMRGKYWESSHAGRNGR